MPVFLVVAIHAAVSVNGAIEIVRGGKQIMLKRRGQLDGGESTRGCLVDKRWVAGRGVVTVALRGNIGLELGRVVAWERQGAATRD